MQGDRLRPAGGVRDKMSLHAAHVTMCKPTVACSTAMAASPPAPREVTSSW